MLMTELFFSGFRVLVFIKFRVEVAVVGQVILLHLALVEPVPGDLFAVGRPEKGLREFELLFIDPVGGAVDDLVDLSVGGELRFDVRCSMFDVRCQIFEK